VVISESTGVTYSGFVPAVLAVRVVIWSLYGGYIIEMILKCFPVLLEHVLRPAFPET
jgi:hypothetical protein